MSQFDLARINAELGLTILLITHEMAVIRSIAREVAVIEGGRIVEKGNVFDVFTRPQHEVTRSFLADETGRALPAYVANRLQKDPVPGGQGGCKPPCAELRGQIAGRDRDGLEQGLGALPGGGEDLAAACVDHGQDGAAAGVALGAAGQRLEARHRGERQAAGLGERASGGDPVAQPGEAARADADGDPLHVLPTRARARQRRLDELQ